MEPAPELEQPPPRPQRETRRVPRSRRPYVRWVVRVVVVGLVFLLGLVVGRALEDAPRPGGEQTGVRTLEPSTLSPAGTVTVTVVEP